MAFVRLHELINTYAPNLGVVTGKEKGDPILINVDNITAIGTYVIKGGQIHTWIRMVTSEQFEVFESFDEVASLMPPV